MNRFKFRGFSELLNDWVYGFVFNYSYRGTIKTYIQSGDYAIKNGSIYGDEVDPETLGLSAGLTDKYRKEIFGGDIVKLTFGANDFQIGEVKQHESGAWYVGETRFSLWVFKGKAEIIGNIHQNPELLK